jgi:hypothetical protein
MFGRVVWRIVAGVLFVALLVGAVGLIGWTAYNTGLAQGAAQSGVQAGPGAVAPAPGTTYVVPYGFPFFGYGFGFLGCIGPLLLFFVLFGLFRLIFWGGMWGRRGWGWGRYGPHGPGGHPGFTPDDIPMRWRQKAEEWHRRMHEQADPDLTGPGKA